MYFYDLEVDCRFNLKSFDVLLMKSLIPSENELSESIVISSGIIEPLGIINLYVLHLLFFHSGVNGPPNFFFILGNAINLFII